MLTRVNSLTRLSADQKTALTNNINSNITGLTTLKAKIDADTDVTTALADVKSIYGTYRVYAEFDPQTNMLATSDTLTKAIDELTQLATKLQSRITDAGAKGNNVDSLKTLLANMQAKIADAKTQQTTVQNNIANLSPSTYNSDPTGVRTTFTTSRTLLKTARTDLQTAIQDARQIILGLKAFKTTTTATPSAGTTMLTPTP
jgi:seryl-tRNA synthetase